MKNKQIIQALMAAIVLFAISACEANKESIIVEDIWARPGLKDGNSAVFFKILNSMQTDDVLLQAKSDIASAVELHKTKMSDGVMKMEQQPSVFIPAGEQVIFKPGDLHIMLIGLLEPLNPGDEFYITLVFEQAGEVRLLVLVQEP